MGFFNEIDALKDHALEPFQNEPGKRRFVQIVFVLLCAAAGVGVAAGIGLAHGKLDLPPWSLFGYALAIVLLSIFAAIWAIARASRSYRRYRGLCQELRELQQGTHDQEFASDAPDHNERNDMERWILGKPEATVDQLAAHPSAVLLPWWHLIGRSRWDLPAAFIGTLVLNVFAVFVLFPLAAEPFHRFPE